MELLPSLLAGLRAVCAAFPDPRKGRGGNIAMADFGLSAFAMFFMQSASFLSFQRAWRKARAVPTARRCSGSRKSPPTTTSATCSTRPIQRCCSPVSSAWSNCSPSRPCARPLAGLGGRTLVAWDGTEYFCSQKLGCPHCLTRKRSNGKIESYHTMLAATVVAPGPFQGGAAVSRIHRAARRRRKAGLRTQRRQALARQAWRTAFARCGPSISATISSPASPSPQW